jgi:hypothetical protein
LLFPRTCPLNWNRIATSWATCFASACAKSKWRKHLRSSRRETSLWKTARLAGVSLREMAQYAVAQGIRAVVDEQTLSEELA